MHYTFVQLCKADQPELGELNLEIPCNNKKISTNIHHTDTPKAELLFKTIFCNANICDNEVDNSPECPLLIDCMNEFIKQTLTCNKFMRSKGNSKSYKNNKYIAKAYPTFFCRTGIEKEIKNIIGDKTC